MIQTITFQNCLNPGTYQDFDVDSDIIVSGDTIFADYQCWESTGNVGGGPSGTVIFTGYTTCQQCNDDFNGWEFEHCQFPGLTVYFGLKNSEVNQYFASTGATISYDGTCYNYTGNYVQGTGSTTYNYTVSELISTNALFTDCASCLNPPSPTPTMTPTPTPTPTVVCWDGVIDTPGAWYYTDCCGVYQTGVGGIGTSVCLNWVLPYDGVAVNSGSVCVVSCPSATPTPTPTVTPSITPSKTPSVTPSITSSVTPSVSSTLGVIPSLTPTITPSISPSATPSTTPQLSPSVTPSLTPSLTPSVTITPTPTPSSGCTQYTFTLQPIYFLTQAGPYNISGTTSGGTTILIATGITNAQLLSGFTTTVCGPVTGGTIQSTGSCTTSITYDLTSYLPQSSPSPTPTITPSRTPSVTPSITPSVTPTIGSSPSITPSVTPSRTPSITPSVTPSRTPSVTPSRTPSITPTPTCQYLSWTIQQCTSGTCSGICACGGSTTITVYTNCSVAELTGVNTEIYTNTSLTNPFTGDFTDGSGDIFTSSGSGVAYVCTIGGGC